MPNTLPRSARGLPCGTTTPDVTDQQKETARVILGAMGKEFYARDEGWLDMATAVSGSGPAYLFYYIEAMD